MIFSDALEVAIGLSFIFIMLSLVLTSVNETIETVMKTRGRELFKGVAELLNDPAAAGAAHDRSTAAKIIYSHPLIHGIMRGTIEEALTTRIKRKLPSYVPSRSFALALIDQTLAGKFSPHVDTATLPSAASAIDQFRLAAERIEIEQVRTALLLAIDTAGGDMERVRANLQGWYDSAMDRVSGWYKRRTQRIIFAVGLLIAVAMNVNTLTIGDSLSKDATLRRAVVAQAETYKPAEASDNAADNATATETPGDAVDAIQKTGLPIGWSDASVASLLRPTTGDHWLLGWLQVLFGFVLTAFAVSLGAPFWFDVLNKLMVIRATVKPTEKSQDEAPQDPQKAKAATTSVTIVPQAAPAPPLPPEAIDHDIYNEPPAADERLFEGDEGVPVNGAAA